MQLKKIAISGLGGVGGYYAAKLMQEVIKEEQGREVYFVARNPHAQMIQKNGLKVCTPSSSFFVRPTEIFNSEELNETKDFPKMDLIILATKSYDLAQNLQQLAPLINEQSIILPLLNGANIREQVQAILPNNEVWYGCTYISGRKKEAGVIELLNDNELFLFGSGKVSISPKEQELLDLLRRSGIQAECHQNIKETIYKKFAMISATATGTTYFNCLVGQALDWHKDEMERLVDEVCSLLEKKGINPQEAKTFVQKRQRIMPPETTSSMHVDFLNHRTSELENLTAYVVHEAEQLGLELPLYKKMYEYLKDVEYPSDMKAKP